MRYMCYNVAWKWTVLSSNYLITMHLPEISGDMPGIIAWKYMQISSKSATQTSCLYCPILISTKFKSIGIGVLIMGSKFLVLPLSDAELLSKTLPLLDTKAFAGKYFLSRIPFNKCINKLCKHQTLHLDCWLVIRWNTQHKRGFDLGQCRHF